MKKFYDRILNIRGNLLTVKAHNVGIGELAEVIKADGMRFYATVLRIDEDLVTLQLVENTRGLSTGDKVCFLRKRLTAPFSNAILGRIFDGSARPIDNGPDVVGDNISLDNPSFNPMKRVVPTDMVRTNIPMIDLFNCLVRSQKIPIFSISGEPYNELLIRISNQTDADVVVIGGMGLRFDDYRKFVDNAHQSGSFAKTVMYIHKAVDPLVECILVPKVALSVAERFASEGKNVLVLLTDMTAFSDALKEIFITMDQIPANRGYPSSLYSDLATLYEKAIDFEKGSITILAVTTMPGDDVTHPVPDNTGYITEGQFYLHNGAIDPFGSLSRLKQQVIGKVTRDDHGEIANLMIRLYADSKKSKERASMGFKLSGWDNKLLQFANLFEQRFMSLAVSLPLEEALNLCWQTLKEIFVLEELGIATALTDRYWGK